MGRKERGRKDRALASKSNVNDWPAYMHACLFAFTHLHYLPTIPAPLLLLLTSCLSSLTPDQQPPVTHLVCNTNNTTSRPSTRITRLLALLGITLAQIVRARMHDDGAAQHALLTDQLDQLISNAPFPLPLSSVLKLPRSPTWRVESEGAPCVLPKGLKCGPAEVQPLVLSPVRRRTVRERTEKMGKRWGREGWLTELVDVHAALGRGVAAADVEGDTCGRGFGGLLECHGASDFGVTAEDCNCGGKMVLADGVWYRA